MPTRIAKWRSVPNRSASAVFGGVSLETLVSLTNPTVCGGQLLLPRTACETAYPASFRVRCGRCWLIPAHLQPSVWVANGVYRCPPHREALEVEKSRVQLPPAIEHSWAGESKERQRAALLQPDQNQRARLHWNAPQYSPSAFSQVFPCSSVVRSRSTLVVTAKGRSFLSSTCARKMLNASPGFIPSRAKTFSARLSRSVGTRARKRVELAMAQKCSNALRCQGRPTGDTLET